MSDRHICSEMWSLTAARPILPSAWWDGGVVRLAVATVVVACTLLLPAPVAWAQVTWTGGGANTNWGDAGNWSGTGPVSSGTSQLVFDGSTGLSSNNDLTGFSASRITFNATAGAFTLDGNTLELSAGSQFGVSMLNSSTSGTQTLAFDMTFTSTGERYINGVSGANTVLSGDISGAGGVTAAPSGHIVTLSGNNSYSGPTIMDFGYLKVASATGLGSTEYLRVFGGSFENTSGADLSVNGRLEVGHGMNLFLGGNRLTVAGNLAPVNNNTFNVHNGTVSVAALQEQASGGLTKTSAGTLEIRGASTRAAQVALNAGTLILGHKDALGSGLFTIAAGRLEATVDMTGANRLPNEVRNNGTINGFTVGGTNSIEFGGTFTFGQSGGSVIGLRNELASGLSLTLNTVLADMAAVGASFRYATFTGPGRTIVAGSINEVNESNPIGISVLDGAHVTLSGSNDYALTTRVWGSSTGPVGSLLRLEHATAIPGGIGVSGGTSNISITNDSILGLGADNLSRGLGTGLDQIGFTGGGGFAAYNADRVVNLGGASAQVTWASGNFVSGDLILGAADATHTLDFQNPIALGTVANTTRTIRVPNGMGAIDAELSGILSGTANLTKTGPGTLVLSAANTFTGAMTIGGGIVPVSAIGASGVAGALGAGSVIRLGTTTESGTLLYTGPGETTDRAIDLAGGGAIVSDGSGPLVFSSPFTSSGAGARVLTLGGTSPGTNQLVSIAGDGLGVDKTGPGLWRLTGQSSFTGRLNVLDGTIVAAAGAGTTNAGVFGAGTSDSVLPVVGNSADSAEGRVAVLLESGVKISRGLFIPSLGADATQEVVLGMTTGTSGEPAEFDGTASTISLGRDVTLQAADGGTIVFRNQWAGVSGTGGPPPEVAFNVGSTGNAGTVVFGSVVPDEITAVNVRRGTLRLAAGNETIGYATPVTLGESSFAGGLDVNGITQPLSRLSFAGVGSEVLGSGTLALYNTGTAIRNSGTTAEVTVTGTGHTIATAVALDNAATFDVAADGRLGISGVIGNGLIAGQGLTKSGLGILELSGSNSYTGITNVNAGGLLVSGTNMGTGLVSIADGWIGGRGRLAGDLTLSGSTARLVFDPAGPLDVAGSVSINSSFSVASLVDVNGLAITDWSSISDGTYTLIGITSSKFDNITNFGLAQAAPLPDGRLAYFENGSLQLVIVPEPGALALAALGLAAAAWAYRRRGPRCGSSGCSANG